MVIDGATVITGSFNFTKAAEERNAENLLVIRSADLARTYSDNWRSHIEHSEKYEGKERGFSEARAADFPRASSGAVDAAAARYVSSRNSEVFHKTSCKEATRISAKNLERYRTREEAIRAGKRPCSECKP